jgi:DNA polymerase-4
VQRGRVARTIVLKLKTADFHTLTRSLTPSIRPRSADELADVACALRERIGRSVSSRYRLVGVGLSGFVDQESFMAQIDLFEGLPQT